MEARAFGSGPNMIISRLGASRDGGDNVPASARRVQLASDPREAANWFASMELHGFTHPQNRTDGLCRPPRGRGVSRVSAA